MMKARKGFTLTELAVAIAFISILLLTIATVTLNMVRTYHKGNTMKEINTVGLELISEFTDAISASSNFDYKSYCSFFTDEEAKQSCEEDKGQKFIFQEKTTKIGIKNTSTEISDAQTYGIFCTGKYTYIWNTGYSMNSDDGEHTKSSDLYEDITDSDKPVAVQNFTDLTLNKDTAGRKEFGNFRLRKYQDQTRSICADAFYTKDENHERTLQDDYEEGSIDNVDLSSQSKSNFENHLISDELIKTQDLAIFSLKVDKPVVEEVSSNALYTIHLTLGSISGGIDTSNKDPSCNMSTNSSYDIEYCATNKFNFTAQTKGSSNI